MKKKIKQNSILLEDIDKIKTLMSIKPSKLISEAGPANINDWVRGFENSAEETTIEWLNRMDKPTFFSFLDALKSKTGQDFNYHINNKFDSLDAEEILTLQNLLKSKFNVDVDNGLTGNQYMRPRQRQFKKTFKITNTNSSTPTVTATPTQNDTKTPTNTPTVTATPTPKAPTSSERFASTAKSLGVENPKMDVATLQKILDTLNASSGAVTESKKSVNEELNTMKYLLGYQRGRVISEQDTATQSTPTPQDLIKQIQTVLKTKYNANLGDYGVDGVDGKWGNLTQTALENALKTAAETKQKADELSQRRAAETQQTATQDTAIQQAVDQGSQNIMNANLQLQAANTQGVQAANTQGVQAANTQGVQAANTQGVQAANTQGVQAANTQGVQAANTQGVQTSYLYTTLVNNKTLQTRNNGNQIVYKGDDLTPAQRQELESKLQTMGYILSTDDRDKRYGDKLIFKKK